MRSCPFHCNRGLRLRLSSLQLNWHFGTAGTLVFPQAKTKEKIYSIEVIEHLYDYQVADVLSLFYKLTNPGGQLLLTTPNYQSAWPLIEWLLDRFGLVATLDEAQHVTHFTKRTLCAMCECAGWKVRHIGTFNRLAPFLAPISRRLALGVEKIEFLLNRTLLQNLLFCLCRREG